MTGVRPLAMGISERGDGGNAVPWRIAVIEPAMPEGRGV